MGASKELYTQQMQQGYEPLYFDIMEMMENTSNEEYEFSVCPNTGGVDHKTLYFEHLEDAKYFCKNIAYYYGNESFQTEQERELEQMFGHDTANNKHCTVFSIYHNDDFIDSYIHWANVNRTKK